MANLYARNMAEKLEDREGNELYCVYTDYESDHNDYYVAILGCKVSSIEYLPEGFTGKAIPASKYMVFTPVGKFPANIGATWQHIWQSGIERNIQPILMFMMLPVKPLRILNQRFMWR
jgi:predicted transcriptional regulator YdeE